MKKLLVVTTFVFCGVLSLNAQAGFWDNLLGNSPSKTTTPQAPTKAVAPQAPENKATAPSLNLSTSSNTMDGTQILFRAQYCTLTPVVASAVGMRTEEFLCEGLPTNITENRELYECNTRNLDRAITTIQTFWDNRRGCRDRDNLIGYNDYALRCGHPRETYTHGTATEEVIRIWRDMSCDCIEDMKKYYNQMISACTHTQEASPTVTPSGPAPSKPTPGLDPKH